MGNFNEIFLGNRENFRGCLDSVFFNGRDVLSQAKVSIPNIKVQLFWEGHKNLHNLLHGFEIYLVNVKTMRKIAQIFVTFSEKLNFTPVQWFYFYFNYQDSICYTFALKNLN